MVLLAVLLSRFQQNSHSPKKLVFGWDPNFFCFKLNLIVCFLFFYVFCFFLLFCFFVFLFLFSCFRTSQCVQQPCTVRERWSWRGRPPPPSRSCQPCPADPTMYSFRQYFCSSNVTRWTRCRPWVHVATTSSPQIDSGQLSLKKPAGCDVCDLCMTCV